MREGCGRLHNARVKWEEGEREETYDNDESFEIFVGEVHDALLSGGGCETLLGKERGRLSCRGGTPVSVPYLRVFQEWWPPTACRHPLAASIPWWKGLAASFYNKRVEESMEAVWWLASL
jgi:hypothetical protein